MSEENKQNETQKPEKKNKLLIITFIIALFACVNSVYLSVRLGAYNPKSQFSQQNSQSFLISKKYDKGQSMAKAQETGKPIVAWFYVDWCGFCKKFAPTFAKLAKNADIKSKYAIAYINCDDPANADLAKEYGIQHFPTLYLIKDGTRKEVPTNSLFTPDAYTSLKNEFMKFIQE